MTPMRESELVINRVAQGIVPLAEGVAWFSALDRAGQTAVLVEIGHYLMQASATVEDGRAGVARAGVKPTVTPAVLITMEPFLQRVGTIIGLPEAEHVKAFRVLVSTFTVADTRRRETRCQGRCTHAWHNLGA
ncbi:DUF5958 family protein [Streptomyces sp. NPDC046915]|uniref:DUF5958 family protein n=1 Tax=Streptomyces sp. NPDC046915 TaxID=3155257 RepID=UPI0034007BEA